MFQSICQKYGIKLLNWAKLGWKIILNYHGLQRMGIGTIIELGLNYLTSESVPWSITWEQLNFPWTMVVKVSYNTCKTCDTL